MAQLFEHILQSINNSEIRQSLEALFNIIGVGKGDKNGSVSVTGNLTGNVTGNVTGVVTGSAGSSLIGNVTGDVTGYASELKPGTAPVNAVGAVGVLTFSGVTQTGELVTIGSDIYEFDSTGTYAGANIEVDISGGASAAQSVTALAAVIGTGTEAITGIDGDGDTVVVTADVKGVAGNLAFSTTCANGSVDNATLVGGLDGTVGDAGTTIVGALGVYVAQADNTIADSNWKLFPHTQYKGTGAAPQTVARTLDLDDGDFESDVIFLDGTTACTITKWTPTVGVTYVLECIDSTADPVVTLSSGITINATGNDKMTFPDADDSMVLKMVSATRMVILSNNGSVTLATA